MGDILTFKASEREIFIYNQELDMVAHHERVPLGEARKVESPEHRSHPKVRYGLEPVKEAFLALGDSARIFLAGLKEKYPRNCGFHARLILQMKEKYCCDDIDAALSHAARYQAFEGRAVERILKARATPRSLESIRIDQARDNLQKLLPEIRQRPPGAILSPCCDQRQLFFPPDDNYRHLVTGSKKSSSFFSNQLNVLRLNLNRSKIVDSDFGVL